MDMDQSIFIRYPICIVYFTIHRINTRNNRVCYSVYMQPQTCGCIDPDYLSLYANENDCLSDLELNFSTNVWSNFDWNQCLNECPLECNQTVYTLTASSVQFIADKYVYLLKGNKNMGLRL
jgi:hypothetical protein